MKPSYYLLFLCFACNETTTPAAEDEVGESASCYTYAGQGDTVKLSLTDPQGNTRGTLDYALAEKDRNTGTLEGAWSGDTLFATYTFRSEGQVSDREVAFLRRGDRLVEGYGPVTADGTAFASRDSLEFTGQMPLEVTECTND
ncbi:hypothetical protein [Lewinella sp. IMCC34191]|uniref:hypothetical protein n=1 Tax=Lewinella sp. IMCC34191 TaxID=2259172 RepID=UPI000E248B3F|nr:hypothetical protein [Lewinella sp. IMCC34191]